MKVILLLLLLVLQVGCAYEQAFDRTPAGSMEIKTIPASRVLKTEKEGSFDDASDALFMRLFRYIKDEEVSMTVPVEAGLERGFMNFYVGSADMKKKLADKDTVKVLDIPARTVASIGKRGSYKQANLDKALAELEQWLKTEDKYMETGRPYGVFWNSPFVPFFLKRYEVHIPVNIRE